jgi:Protein-L-isoaspartate(D-aspartate) O-methyltransferase (PCMT)
VSFPTDLSPAEEAQARAMLTELADRFVARGELRTPQWREVFERTWRHPYVPAYHPDRDTPAVLCLGATRSQWLEAVYSDTTLLTKLMPLPMDRTLRPAMTTIYTSSSTLPSLVLNMLELLDVTEGHRVLEVGSGYNAACSANASAAPRSPASTSIPVRALRHHGQRHGPARLVQLPGLRHRLAAAHLVRTKPRAACLSSSCSPTSAFVNYMGSRRFRCQRRARSVKTELRERLR